MEKNSLADIISLTEQRAYGYASRASDKIWD